FVLPRSNNTPIHENHRRDPRQPLENALVVLLLHEMVLGTMREQVRVKRRQQLDARGAFAPSRIPRLAIVNENHGAVSDWRYFVIELLENAGALFHGHAGPVREVVTRRWPVGAQKLP